MTWEVIDIESGDVLAEYGSFETAKERLLAYVEDHPERADDLAIATLDDQGNVVGEPVGAAKVSTSNV